MVLLQQMATAIIDENGEHDNIEKSTKYNFSKTKLEYITTELLHKLLRQDQILIDNKNEINNYVTTSNKYRYRSK